MCHTPNPTLNGGNLVPPRSSKILYPKGPKYLYGTKYDLCSSNFPYGLGKYSPYGYLGPFGVVIGFPDILGEVRFPPSAVGPRRVNRMLTTPEIRTCFES